jgi:hypothetical protein
MLDRRRPLRLVLDDPSLSADDVALLRVFAADAELEIWHTRQGIEQHLEVVDDFDTPFPMGGSRTVFGISAESSTMFGIYGVDRLREQAAAIAAETGENEEEAFRALAFAAASDELDADGFVTTREYVLAKTGSNRAIAFSPNDAFALIGLVRRAHGNDTLGSDMMNVRLGGSTYHFILERELLRDGWPWFSGLVSSGSANGEDGLVYLGQTARERFTRVLQIRERVHLAAKGEPTRARGDEIVFQLETLLMFLSAGFDAAARVAHVVYFGGDYGSAGWRRERWRERLREAAPELAVLADDETTGGALLQLIGALRNTIHGEGLRAGEVAQAGQPPAQLVRVTEREAERLKRLLAQIGADPTAWGVHETTRDLRLAADRFIEALVPEATALLNRLMAATDTTRLPGAAGAPIARLVDQPSPEWWNDMLSFEIRQRVRLLSGL